MVMNVEVSTDAEEAVRQRLAAEGIEVEEPSEESKETPPEGEAKTEETEKEKAAVSETVPAKEKKEETQEPDKKEDWDSLPDWAKKRITKLRDDKRELRDTIEHERAVRPSAPAGRERETVAKETAKDSKEPEFTYCGRPKPTIADFEKADDPYAALADAVGEWHADEKIAKVRFESRVREQFEADQEIQTAFDERLAEAATLIPEYGEIMEESSDDVRASSVMHGVIKASEVGPYILLHLAKNPDECKRIFGLGDYVRQPNGSVRIIGDPEAAKRAMHRLEAKVETEVETLKEARKGKKPPEPPKKKTASSAPPPETPLRGTEPKSKSLREMSGPEERILDAPIKFNPELERKREEQRRGR